MSRICQRLRRAATRARNPRPRSPSPPAGILTPDLPGIGGRGPPPICRGSGVHPHPHPDLPGIGDHPHPQFPSGVPCPGSDSRSHQIASSEPPTALNERFRAVDDQGSRTVIRVLTIREYGSSNGTVSTFNDPILDKPATALRGLRPRVQRDGQFVKLTSRQCRHDRVVYHSIALTTHCAL
jgi:hypothetical protein